MSYKAASIPMHFGVDELEALLREWSDEGYRLVQILRQPDIAIFERAGR